MTKGKGKPMKSMKSAKAMHEAMESKGGSYKKDGKKGCK